MPHWVCLPSWLHQPHSLRPWDVLFFHRGHPVYELYPWEVLLCLWGHLCIHVRELWPWELLFNPWGPELCELPQWDIWGH